MLKTVFALLCSGSALCLRQQFSLPVMFFILISVFQNTNAVGQDGYFQQRLNYKINVLLNDNKNVLSGDLSIEYINNSPDTLHFIWMHLWPNAYSDRRTALCKQMVENKNTSLYFAESKLKGKIDSLNFKADGENVEMIMDTDHRDICKILLKKPIPPGGNTEISSPFRVEIPDSKFSRLGHSDDAFYITQWYPKPAVYDRNGWHPMPYLNQGEFYSEFGNYEVAITLPQNYVVTATGELQNKDEKMWLAEKNKSTAAKHVFTDDTSFPESSSQFKTITFRQDSIHDFAWFADKRFHVLMGEVKLPGSDRKISTAVYFTGKKAPLWKNTLNTLEKGIRFLSEEVGEYPYNSFSVVDGTISAGGGMEYPMITIINSPGDPQLFELTVFHELCHNWFYGVLANNERADGWMDEGLTTFYELKYAEKFLSGTLPGHNNLSGSLGVIGKLTGVSKMNSADVYNLTYKFSAFNNSDQPVKTPSAEFTEVNYGTVMYQKTALSFRFLEDYLGEAMFRECIKNYFSDWKFKHPDPDAMKNSFETVSNKNLSWFFDELLETNKPLRYKIRKAGKDSIRFTGKSGIGKPLKIETVHGGITWIENVTDTTVLNSFRDNDYFFIDRHHNVLFKSCDLPYKTGSGTRKWPETALKQFYQVTDQPGQETFYILPVPAWNNYDKWMAGIHFSNMDLIPEPFEFYLTPLFDFRNQTLTGLAGFDYNYWPLNGTFSEIKLSMYARRFIFAENNSIDEKFRHDHPAFFYSKVEPGVTFRFRKSNLRSPVTQTISFRNISIWIDEVNFIKVDTIYHRKFVTTLLNFNELTWKLNNNRIIDPFNISIRGEQGQEHLKFSFELNYRFSYKKNKKGIDARLFAGGFARNKTTDRNYNFRMSGWPGYHDYLYDETFFGRSDRDGFWSRQFLVRDGGFKIPTFVGQTNKWLAAINVSIDIPVPLPLRFFIDAGTYEGISTVFEGITSKLMYSGGISVVPVRDVFEIHIPLFSSEDIERSLETNNVKFAEQIRFVFNINKLSPLHLRNRTIYNFQ